MRQKKKSACWKCVICMVRKCWEKTTLPEVHLSLVILLTINSSGFQRVTFIFNLYGESEREVIFYTWSRAHQQREEGRGWLWIYKNAPAKTRVILNLYFLDYVETECVNACGKESKQKASWLLTWVCRIHLNQHLPMWFLKCLPSTVWDTRVNKLNWNNRFPQSKSKHSMDIWLGNVLWHSIVCFVGHCDSLNALNKSINWLFNSNRDRSKI